MLLNKVEQAITPNVAQGDPRQSASNIASWASGVTGMALFGVPTLAAVAYLYDKTLVKGREKTWGLGDYLLVIAIAYAAFGAGRTY